MPDPDLFGAPKEGSLSNPQRLNRYSYCLNNPYKYVDPDGRLTVSIWNYTGKNQNWGHASITLEDGTHISWWPSKNRVSTFPGFMIKLIPQLANIYSADALKNQTFAKDVEYEGSLPNEQIKINGLDEGKIKQWWEPFKNSNKWQSLTQNCSTTAADALKAGGADVFSSWLKSNNLVWTPQAVLKYAQEIVKKQKEE